MAVTDPVPPLYVIAGVAVEETRLRQLTLDFLALKQQFYPGMSPGTGHFLDWILPEVKGADIRRGISSRGSKKTLRHGKRFLDQFVTLLERYEIHIFGRVWVKAVGHRPKGDAIYTSSVQSIAATFQHLLAARGDKGYMIADSVVPAANVRVAQSIFTQKYQSGGDPYSRILETPLFAHSQNHVGIQIADLVCSALLFPMSAARYCLGTVKNFHVDRRYENHLCAPYGPRLKRLQFRYSDGKRMRGGVVVDDKLSHRSGAHLFSATPLAPRASIATAASS